jgi:hypothetical protein
MPAPASAVIPDEIVSLSYPDLVSRKEYIDLRLSEIALPVRATISPVKKRKLQHSTVPLQSVPVPAQITTSTSTNAAADVKDQSQVQLQVQLQVQEVVPIVTAATKTADTHWDFLMKEMMWLATDFQAERKRHGSSRRKLCNGIRLGHTSKAARQAREISDAVVKRKKLAARLGREVKGWWTKIERVVSYKQKLSAEKERQAAMNKQLVALVKQTERYSESLARQDYDDDDSDDDPDTDHHRQAQHRHRRRNNNKNNKYRLTIEEALATAHKTRRSKARVTDYARLQLEKDDSSFYGESTAESDNNNNNNSGSDASCYTPSENDSSDDETTFLQAQLEETMERRRLGRTAKDNNDTHDHDDHDNNDNTSFMADPVELQKLQEESTMDIDKVLERLRDEAQAQAAAAAATVNDNEDDDSPENMDIDNDMNDNSDEKGAGSKKVTFAPTPEVKASTRTRTRSAAAAKKPVLTLSHTAEPDPGSDADDDADASDVEDFVDNDDMDMGSEDFVADENEVDDETTMAQEESLPVDMTVDEEISMLEDENKLSVEELRQKYAAALQANENENEAVADSSEPDPADDSAGHASLEELLEVDDTIEEEEFRPADGTDVDDETTMEVEEKLGRDMTVEAEIDLLQNESEIPIEKLREMYASMNNNGSEGDEDMESEEDVTAEDTGTTDNSVLHELAAPQVEDGDADEFEPNDGDAVDDETTMDAEEKMGRDMSYDDEIALLKRESEMTVEELKAMYAGLGEGADEASVDDDNGMDEGADKASEDDGGLDQGVDEGSGDDGDPAVVRDLFELTGTAEEQENDDEFSPDGDEKDDETTMDAEERLGGWKMSPEAELAMLKEQGEIPIESLRSMYQQMEEEEVEESGTSSLSKRKRESETVDASTKKTRQDPEEDDSDDAKAALEALEASAERAQKTLASRPYLLTPWVKLREYQQIGLNWLVSLQSRRLNGILADGESDIFIIPSDLFAVFSHFSIEFVLQRWVSVSTRLCSNECSPFYHGAENSLSHLLSYPSLSLGKTLQTISLFSYLAAYKGIWGPHLVVVPTSVIINWETELKRFCPALKVLCYYGSAKRRKELRTGWTKTNWYHVVITSYQLAVQDAFAFKRKRWYYLVLDEAQNIKNFQSQRWQTLISFNTQRRLLLTGTPLQNNLMELWSLLHFLMPYIFRSRKEFSYWFANPMNNMIEGVSNQNDEVIGRLHGIIRPFILRRLKKDVETQMPGKYEHIVKCQLSRRQVCNSFLFLSI